MQISPFAATIKELILILILSQSRSWELHVEVSDMIF